MIRVRVGILVTSVFVLLPVLVWGSDPVSALAALESGNQRFVAGASNLQPVGRDRRAELAEGQTAFATVLSPAGRRVPPGLVLNVGPGDLFVARAPREAPPKFVLGK